MELRLLAGVLLSAPHADVALVRALRAGLRHRRGELDLLPARQAGRGRPLGRPDAAGLRLRGEALAVSDANEAPDGQGARRAAALRAPAAADRLRQARAGAVAAARALPPRRRAARVRAGPAAART